jgi:hypothetical protein
MTTPNYQGGTQPNSDNSVGGILGWLSGIFGSGGNTPAYSGDGQPSAGASGGMFGGGSPAYKPASAVAQSPPTGSVEMQQCTQLEADPFGSGPIAIVIPRQG